MRLRLRFPQHDGEGGGQAGQAIPVAEFSQKGVVPAAAPIFQAPAPPREYHRHRHRRCCHRINPIVGQGAGVSLFG